MDQQNIMLPSDNNRDSYPSLRAETGTHLGPTESTPKPCVRDDEQKHQYNPTSSPYVNQRAETPTDRQVIYRA